MANGTPEFSSWSEEYYSFKAPLNEAINKVHQYEGISVMNFHLGVSRGLIGAGGSRYVNLDLDLDRGEIETAPADIAKVFQDLGISEVEKLQAELKLTIPYFSRLAVKKFDLRYTPMVPTEDQYGVLITSKGEVEIAPNKPEYVDGYHPMFAVQNIVEGDSPRAKMLQKVYMEGMHTKGSTIHPYVSRILIASADWMASLIEGRRVNFSNESIQD